MQQLVLSVAETARTLGLGRTKVYDLLDSGELKSVRVGRRRLVSAASVRSLLGEIAA